MPTIANDLRRKLTEPLLEDFACSTDCFGEWRWGRLQMGRQIEKGEALYRRLEDA
jgi:hypothetical protein